MGHLIGFFGVCAAVLVAPAGGANINFASGCAAGPAQGPCTTKLVRFVDLKDGVEKIAGAHKDKVEGFYSEVWAMVCDGLEADGSAVACYEAAGPQDHVWEDGRPGPGLHNKWYDVAITGVSSVKSLTYDFSYLLAARPPHYYVATGVTTLPDTASYDKDVVFRCGDEEGALLGVEFPKAKVSCVPEIKAGGIEAGKLYFVDQSTYGVVRTGAGVSLGEEVRLTAKPAHASSQQDAVAFTTIRGNACVMGLINDKLRQIISTTAFENACTRNQVSCMKSATSRQDFLKTL